VLVSLDTYTIQGRLEKQETYFVQGLTNLSAYYNFPPLYFYRIDQKDDLR